MDPKGLLKGQAVPPSTSWQILNGMPQSTAFSPLFLINKVPCSNIWSIPCPALHRALCFCSFSNFDLQSDSLFCNFTFLPVFVCCTGCVITVCFFVPDMVLAPPALWNYPKTAETEWFIFRGILIVILICLWPFGVPWAFLGWLLGVPLEPLGCPLGCLWGRFVASWRLCRLPWGPFGVPWGPSGLPWVLLRISLGSLLCLLGSLGSILGSFWVSWASLGVPCAQFHEHNFIHQE